MEELENEIKKTSHYFNKVPEGYIMMMKMYLQGQDSYRYGELQNMVGFSEGKVSKLLDMLEPVIKPCWKEEGDGTHSRALKLVSIEKVFFKHLENKYGREALEEFVKKHQTS